MDNEYWERLRRIGFISEKKNRTTLEICEEYIKYLKEQLEAEKRGREHDSPCGINPGNW